MNKQRLPWIPVGGAILILMLPLCAPVTVFAQDTVWTRQPNSPKTNQRTGRIVDFTGAELSLETGGNVRRIPSSQVVKVQTARVEDHQLAEEQIAQGNYLAALTFLTDAVGTETRTWVQRQILAARIRCADALGQPDGAIADFRQIAKSDPATQYFHLIPLAWTTVRPPPRLARAMETWVTGDDEISGLIAASWLIGTRKRADSLTRLKQLANSSDSRIAHMAQAQLWRVDMLSPPSMNIDRWTDQVARMPPSIRGGPYFVLGEALSRQKQIDPAVWNLMRVPIQHPSQYSLAAQSLSSAGRLLISAGRNDEARLVLDELVRDYPLSPLADDARGTLQQLAGDSGSNNQVQ